MKNKIWVMMVLIFGLSNAQIPDFLSATDTSESSVRKHHGHITRNQEIVDYIEYTLKQSGIPKHLRNLALIESHFNRGAVSWVGASGVWQFMPAHAEQYGLSAAERADIYRSTKIAAKSLKNIYKKYGNWITVVAAYNCGEGNVNKAMRRAGSKDYGRFYPFLPDESINHVKKYLNACYATGELAEVQQDYARFAGYPSKPSPRPAAVNSTERLAEKPAEKPVEKAVEKPTLAEVVAKSQNSKISAKSLASTEINGGYDLAVIAEYVKTDLKKIMTWNPGIRKKLESRGEATLYLPYDLMVLFNMNKNTILNESLKVIRDKDQVQALN